MRKEEAPDLAKLFSDLQVAQERYDEAHMKAQAASSEETRCVNDLSAAQKALDRAMEDLHKKAPWNTEWHSQRQQKRHQSAEP